MVKDILLIAGTRPNFIKLAPLYHQLRLHDDYKVLICHTGQHFDFNMSDIFWQNLELPPPDFQLNIQGDGVVDTIGKTILGINEVLLNNRFDLVIVFGDVNATAAGAIAAVQSQLKVMHVEAGLRSFDRSMPEEINRIITDHISNFLMVSEPCGIVNLRKEGFDKHSYEFVGNIMIESLIRTRPKWEKIQLPLKIEKVMADHPVVMTFHRPENVDHELPLTRLVEIAQMVAKDSYVVFPLHPRTKAKLKHFALLESIINQGRIILTEPLGYFHFLKTISGASMVITDSGGIQEETSFLQIPCVTVRKNTERPITVSSGTNMMMDIYDNHFLSKIASHKIQLENQTYEPIPFWDDKVSCRIINFIKKKIGS
jgi:UDP-N-acetylglucosamine 2-epimerase (non-hydrolysing)